MKQESHSEHNAIHISGDGASMKAERLAPLEERTLTALQPPNDEGGLNADTGSLKLPATFTEKGKYQLFGLEPITIIILVFALAFIGFIAYLISIEPPKSKDEPVPVNIELQS